MVDKNLVNKLLKELEKEQGCPVEIHVFRFDNLRVSVDEFGSTYQDRKAIIRRIEDLPEEHRSDVEKLEGEYDNLWSVQVRAEQEDITHRPNYAVKPDGVYFSPIEGIRKDDKKIADVELALTE